MTHLITSVSSSAFLTYIIFYYLLIKFSIIYTRPPNLTPPLAGSELWRFQENLNSSLLINRI